MIFGMQGSRQVCTLGQQRWRRYEAIDQIKLADIVFWFTKFNGFLIYEITLFGKQFHCNDVILSL